MELGIRLAQGNFLEYLEFDIRLAQGNFLEYLEEKGRKGGRGRVQGEKKEGEWEIAMGKEMAWKGKAKHIHRSIDG